METPTDPQTHSHTHKDTFCELCQSETLKHICSSPVIKMIVAQAVGLLAGPSPSVHISAYRHLSTIPHSRANMGQVAAW